MEAQPIRLAFGPSVARITLTHPPLNILTLGAIEALAAAKTSAAGRI